jgi:heat shock protein HtpX
MSEYNAAITNIGWRRRTTVFIGLPYFAVLSNQEKVAVLGHEIGHSVNGDPARGFFIGAAITSLSAWHAILYPDYIHDVTEVEGEGGCFVLVARVPMRMLAGVVHGFAALLAQLLWRDSQRAEYHADILAAQVAGKAPEIASLEKSYLHPAFELTVQKVLMNNTPVSLLETFRSRTETIPRREIERFMRADDISEAQVDTTHPPTNFRLKLLESLPDIEPMVTLGDAEAERIAAEFAPFREEIEQQILDSYSEYLYG